MIFGEIHLGVSKSEDIVFNKLIKYFTKLFPELTPIPTIYFLTLSFRNQQNRLIHNHL